MLQGAHREGQTQHPLPHQAGPTAQHLAHTVADPQVHLAQAPSTTGWDLAPTTVGQAWQQQSAAGQVPTMVAHSSSTAGQVPTMDLLAHHPLRATTPGPPTLERGVAAVGGGDLGVGGRTPMTHTPSTGVRGAGVTLAGGGLAWHLEGHMVDPMHLQVGSCVDRVLTVFDHALTVLNQSDWLCTLIDTDSACYLIQFEGPWILLRLCIRQLPHVLVRPWHGEVPTGAGSPATTGS